MKRILRYLFIGLIFINSGFISGGNETLDLKNSSSNLSKAHYIADPAVTITSTASSPTSSGVIPLTFTFSANVVGFTESDVVVSGGTLDGFAGDGSVYTANLTPAAAGTITVDVSASVAQDEAGNDNTAATTFSIVYDNVAPSVAITTSANSPTNSNSIPLTFTFSEAVSGFDITDIVASGGTLDGFAGTGTVYTADLTPSAAGTITVDVLAIVAQDEAGNDNTAATTFSIVYDNVTPSVAIATSATSPTNSNTIPLTFTFSEAVSGFDITDIVVSGGTLDGFAGTGAVYTADLTPSAAGTITVDVLASVAQDEAGNDNTAATTFSIVYDNVAPSVAITTSATSPTNSNTIPLTFTFSEAVSGFDITDIVVSGGTLDGFAGDGAVYTANLTPSAAGTITVDVLASVAQDEAGNDNTAATTFSIVYDNVAPSVAVTSSITSPTNSNTIPLTFTFSEAVSGFDITDIVVSGGTLSDFEEFGAVYTANLTPTAAGTITVDVEASVAQDEAGNDNTAATTFSIVYDNVAPSVAITSSIISPTNSNTIPLTFTFSEAVSGFDITDIVVSGGTLSDFEEFGAAYTANLTPTAAGTITVDVEASVAQDEAGNDNTAATTFSIVYDNVAPSVAIATSATSPTNSNTIPLTFTFSEAVSGFDITDIVASGGTLDGFAGTGTVYTADLTPSAAGTITVDVLASVAQDEAGNDNTAATTFSIVYDNVAPSVAITTSATSPTNSNTIPLTFTFSEAVSGFDITDIVVSGGTLDGFAGDGAVYTTNLTPSAAGTITVDVLASVAQDEAGNDNTAATTFSIVYDNVAPSVVGIKRESPLDSVTLYFQVKFRIEFSEAVSGVSTEDFELIKDGTVTGSISSVSTISANQFDIIVSGIGMDGTIKLNLNASGTEIKDMAGNDIAEGFSSGESYTIDNTAPLPPIILGLLNDAGHSSEDQITKNQKLEVYGKSEKHARIILESQNGAADPETLGQTYADENGDWSFLYTGSDLGEGQFSIFGYAYDQVGFISESSDTLTVAIDLTIPASPVITAISDDTGIAGDNQTSDQTLLFHGTAEPESKINLNNLITSEVAGYAFADSEGKWTIDYTDSILVEGTHQFFATTEDIAGNISNPSSTLFLTIDVTAPPTPTITGISDDHGSSVTDGITYDDRIIIRGIALPNTSILVKLDGTDLGTANSNSSGLWSYNNTLQPLSGGKHILTALAVDPSGNKSLPSAEFEVTIDLTSPTVVITSTTTDSTSVNPISFTLTFNEDVTGLELTDFEFENGTVENLEGSGNEYTVDFFPEDEGNIMIKLKGLTVRDIAGLGNAPSPEVKRYFDGSEPTVALSTSAGAITNSSQIPVQITFNEKVTGFTSSDITITGASISNFSGSGRLYSFDAIPVAEGLIKVSIPGGVAKDVSGNLTLASEELSVIFDISRPTAVFSTSAPDPTYLNPLPIIVTFNEVIQGFDLGDVDVTGGSVTNLQGSGKDYTLDIFPFEDGEVTITLNGNIVFDEANNGNVATTPLKINYKNCTVPQIINSPISTAICAGNALMLGVSAIGTDLIYQWQMEEENGFTDVVNSPTVQGAKSDTLKILSGVEVFNDKKFRVVVSGWCEPLTISDTVSVTVYPELFAGKIGSDQKIGKNGKPELITSINDASGGNGTILYQWESSTNGVDFVTIDHAVAASYSPEVLVETTHFRRKVAAGCGDFYSNTVMIEVDELTAIEDESPAADDMIPNALFPNGSFDNKTWGISHMNYNGPVKIKVFTSNGQVVFSTNKASEEWNGTYNGNPAPEGVYFYVIEGIRGKLVQGTIQLVY